MFLVLAAVVGMGATLVAPPALGAEAAGPVALVETATTLVEVNPSTAPYQANAQNVPVATVTIEVAGGGHPDGRLAIDIDGREAFTRTAFRSMTITLPTTALGDHTVTARYLGSTTQAPSTSGSAGYRVVQASTYLEADVATPTTRADVVAVSLLSGTSNPSLRTQLQVTDNGRQLDPLTISGTTGLLPLSDLDLGPHDLTFVFAGTDTMSGSRTTLSLTVTEDRRMFWMDLRLDRGSPVVGTDPVVATAVLTPAPGTRGRPQGDVLFHLDGVLVATADAGTDPVAVELPVDVVGRHVVTAQIEESETQYAVDGGAAYEVTKGTTSLDVDDSHEYSRSETVPISIVTDGGAAPTGLVHITGGRGMGESPTETLEAVDGVVDYPLHELGSGTRRLRVHYVGDDFNQPTVGDVEFTIAMEIGETRIVSQVDRTDPVVGSAPVVGTVHVVVGGGAAPRGELRFSSDGGVFAVRDAGAGPVTVQLPVDRAYQRTTVEFVPSDPSQRTSASTLGYTVQRATTETRVAPPRGAVSEGVAMAVSVAVVDAPVAARGRVLVTDGTPRGCDHTPEWSYLPPDCDNALGVVPLTDASGTFVLPSMSAGEHALVFGYYPADQAHGGDRFVNTGRSEAIVPVVVTVPRVEPGRAATSTAVSVDRDLVTATVTATDGTIVGGTVAFSVDGAPLATVALSDGQASARLPRSAAGWHSITARYSGTGTHAASQTETRRYVVPPSSKARSHVRATITQLPKRRLSIKVSATSTVALTGRVRVTEVAEVVTASGKTRTRSRVIATGAIRRSGRTVTVALRTRRLEAGSRLLTVEYLGSPTALAAERSYRTRIG